MDSIIYTAIIEIDPKTVGTWTLDDLLDAKYCWDTIIDGSCQKYPGTLLSTGISLNDEIIYSDKMKKGCIKKENVSPNNPFLKEKGNE